MKKEKEITGTCYCGGNIIKKAYNKEFDIVVCEKCGEVYMII
jgi:hypothetical protein